MIKDLSIVVLKSAFVIFSILTIAAIAMWALSSHVGYEPTLKMMLATLGCAALIEIMES